jgi:putative transposase
MAKVGEGGIMGLSMTKERLMLFDYSDVIYYDDLVLVVIKGNDQVWSWDITWLPSPIRSMYFYLYMIMDVYSRKIIGWEVHPMESAELSAPLVQKAILSEKCLLDPPVLHADNGGPQKGFTMRAKLEDLGVTPSYSRPRVSNDNPYSESLFRTIKYRPQYPVKGFECIDAARKWVGRFVKWYNEEHRHSAIRYVTPSQRHKGEDIKILDRRHQVYQQAKEHRQDRWSGATRNWEPITEVWLNCPKDSESKATNVSRTA